MGRPIVTSVTLVAAVANGIAQSQSLPGASGLSAVLNGSLVTGGVAVMDTPRRVIITSAGNDSGITFTVTGTGRSQATGQVAPTISETIAGANVGAAQTTQDFGTVTGVTASAGTAGAITIGTNGTASGPWVPWDQNVVDFQVSLVGYVLTGTPTWEVEYTYDDVFGLWLPANVPFARPIVMATMVGATGTLDGVLTIPVRASRLTITSVGASPPSGVQLTSTQQGGHS